MRDIPNFMRLFPPFCDPSWDAWRPILARLAPTTVREFYGIIGRGAGKSRIAALLAAFFASRQYSRLPGENIYIGVFAPDRRQAGLTFRYILGLLQSVPALAALIVSQGKESIELSNGIIVEVITATTAAPRGRAYALAIVEEAAFLPSDASANPDVELLRALRPALARVPGSLLVVISSPYARKGVLHTAYQRHHGKPDSDIVVIQAATLDLNPTFDRRAIETAYAEDPASAAAEYGATFRSDVESFVSREALDAAVVAGRIELAPVPGLSYVAFVDPSGGSADSMTLGVAHVEREANRAVLDAVREVRPPFSPESAVADFAVLLKTYQVRTVVGDRYAGEWPRERFREHGIAYEIADRSKSEIYRDTLPLVNSGRVELLDNAKLISQLASLERRTARGGRDSIDHAPGAHDDVANAACGALVNCAVRPAGIVVFNPFTGAIRQGTDANGVTWRDGQRVTTFEEWKATAPRPVPTAPLPDSPLIDATPTPTVNQED